MKTIPTNDPNKFAIELADDRDDLGGILPENWLSNLGHYFFNPGDDDFWRQHLKDIHAQELEGFKTNSERRAYLARSLLRAEFAEVLGTGEADVEMPKTIALSVVASWLGGSPVSHDEILEMLDKYEDIRVSQEIVAFEGRMVYRDVNTGELAEIILGGNKSRGNPGTRTFGGD